jgi:digeranylgeranylglycerophospholipid reductase
MCAVCDVIVIGGGPAGSTVAKYVANKGFNVLIVEKSRFPGQDNVCGGCLSIKAFKESGADDEICEKRIFNGIHHFPWGEIHRRMKNASFRRKVFDKHLAEKACESGAKLKTSSKVFDVRIENGISKVFYKDVNNGKLSHDTSFLVVFADGTNSICARRFPSVGFHSNLNNTALGIVCELPWKDNPLSNSEYYHGPNFTWTGYGWIFPKKDVLNIGVCARLSALKRDRRNIRSVLGNFLSNHHVTKRLLIKGALNLSSALIPLAPANKLYAPSILVVGDAAGMVCPIWMGGLAFCIYAGKVAGQTIVKALEQQDYSEKFLSRYQTLWQNSDYFSWIREKFIMYKLIEPFTRIDKSLPTKYTALSLIRGRKKIRKSLNSLLYPLKF